MAELCTATIRAVAQGVVGIAFIQMLLIGVAFLIKGIPGAGLLALAILLLGIMQLPATLITVPVIAVVFATEGIGLWMQKRWAEWLTVIITASLIPLEVWELAHRPSFGIAAVLVANSAIVAYLAWHVVRSRAKHRG